MLVKAAYYIKNISFCPISRLEQLRDAAEKAKTSGDTVKSYESQLISLDTMSSDVPGLKEQVDVLEVGIK